jgi:phosphate transport system protein
MIAMHENRHILDVKKNELKQTVLQMSKMTDESFQRALQCIEQCDRHNGEMLIIKDQPINQYYDKTERSGFYVIASQQPVAHDLREIVVAMRIASELERIADHVANIAKIRLEISRSDMSGLCVTDLIKLGRDALSIYQLAMTAYRELDTGKAESLKEIEARIDQTTNTITLKLFDRMRTDPDLIEDGSRALWILHTLERIADRATNIAEQVIYAATAHEEKLND